MRRVLIVAYFFPPIAASGSLRPLGFCRYLERYGWIPEVLTTDTNSVYPPIDVDQSLAALIPNSIKVHRVAHPNPARTLIQIRESMRRKVRSILGKSFRPILEKQPIHENKLPAYSKGWVTSIKDYFWNWLFLFPDQQRYWLRAAIRTMSRLQPHEYPDVVWATGRPWTGLLLGMRLAQVYNVPFLADFRDPWQGNPYVQPLTSRLSQRAKSLERSICQSAAKVISTTPELSKHFKSAYPDLEQKFQTITNGFDNCDDSSDSLGKESTFRQSVENKKTRTVEICHFGTIYGARNPFPLLQAIKELMIEEKIASNEIRVKFVGRWDLPGEDEEIVKDLEAKGILSRIHQIPHRECLQEMARTDFLLILQPDSPLQIPGKIYEYLCLKIPILVIGDEGATASLVKKYQLGVCCPNKVLTLKQIIFDLINQRQQIAPPPNSIVSSFHYHSLTEQLALVLDSVH